MIGRNVEPLTGEMQLIQEHVSREEPQPATPKPVVTKKKPKSATPNPAKKKKPKPALKEEPTLLPHPPSTRYGANELGEIREAISGQPCRMEVMCNNSQSYYLKEDGMHDVYDIVKVEKIVWKCFNRPLVFGERVRHIDGDPGNNKLSNLELYRYLEYISKTPNE